VSANPDQVEISAALAGTLPVRLTASPALQHHAAQLVAGSAGALTFRFTIPAESMQGNGVVGGGAISTVLDLAMALAVLSAIDPGATCSTLSLTVNFLSSLREPDVTVDARVDRTAKRAAFASATAVDGAGRAVATATASLLVHGTE
jgi:uncharacterized protein (TIGR00369 family)